MTGFIDKFKKVFKSRKENDTDKQMSLGMPLTLDEPEKPKTPLGMPLTLDESEKPKAPLGRLLTIDEKPNPPAKGFLLTIDNDDDHRVLEGSGEITHNNDALAMVKDIADEQKISAENANNTLRHHSQDNTR